MSTIKKIRKAAYEPMGDLLTYRALPLQSLDSIDPFLLLNHHGPQTYKANNGGLPFGPHPHRGMETVTFIIAGDIVHRDSGGHDSTITAGGVQWMTAGRGVIHEEVSSNEFKQNGGPLEILQLWVNLPARSKMTEPFYKGLQKEEIPTVVLDEGKVTVNLISGKWGTHQPAFESGIGVHLNTIYFKAEGGLSIDVPKGDNILFYLIKGKLKVNDADVNALSLVEFEQDGGALTLAADEESILLYGHAKPLNEPVVSHGPFVMNTMEEIKEAYDDYRKGKFGAWNH